MKKKIDFLEDTTNVYRTKNFIIKQKIYIKTDIFCNILLFSQDFYYLKLNKEILFSTLFLEIEAILMGTDYIQTVI